MYDGMCFGNQRAFRVLQSWSVRAKEEPGRMCTFPYTWPSGHRACVSEISGHSGCCSPGLCEQKGARSDVGVSTYPGIHLFLANHLAGIPGVAVLVCASKRGARTDSVSRTWSCGTGSGHFRVLQSWSVRAKEEPGRMAYQVASPGPVFRKSAGIPGVAVLVCARAPKFYVSQEAE